MSTGGQAAGGGGDGGAAAAAAGGGDGAIPWASVGEGQTWEVGGKPWYEVGVGEGEREAIATKKYAHPGVLAKSYVELERQLASRDDSKTIRIPDENAKPEDWDAVYTKLGRPTNPDGYKDVKWGDDADTSMVEFAKSLAFKLGLSPKAAESVMATEWNAFVAAQAANATKTTSAANEQALANLQAEWKGDFDGNRARGLQVMQALNKAGFSDADMAAIEKVAGITPVIKLLATIGKLTGEGNLMDGGGSGGKTDPANMTPEQAKSEVQKRTADAAFQKTYMTPTEPGHKEAVSLMEQLYKKAGTTISQ